MIERYRYIGKSTARKDARDIVTGKAVYLDDLKFPHMLFGRALRSPYPHAMITEIDTRKAEALAGVHAVLTYQNVPEWKTGMPKQFGVLDRKVRFVGDAVALVAAESEAIAEQAVDLIDVTYEKLSAVYDVEAAMAPDAPQLFDAFQGNIVPPFPAFGPKTIDDVVTGDVTESDGRSSDREGIADEKLVVVAIIAHLLALAGSRTVGVAGTGIHRAAGVGHAVIDTVVVDHSGCRR